MTSEDELRRALAEGLELGRTGQPEAAVGHLAALADGAPGSAWARFVLASEQAANGNIAAAEAQFEAALSCDPDFRIARYQLGLLRLSSGRAEAAMQTWQPLLQAAGDDPYRQFVEGFRHLSEDRFVQALEAFEKGLATPVDNAAVWWDIRQVVEAVGVLGKTATAGGQGAGVDDSGSPDSVTAHVLLANYRRQ